MDELDHGLFIAFWEPVTLHQNATKKISITKSENWSNAAAYMYKYEVYSFV
jgi:hypothetical protein